MNRSSTRMVLWIVVGLILVCLLLCCCIVVVGAVSWTLYDGFADDSTDYKLTYGMQVGEYAPDFTLSLLDGSSVTLSDFRGKPVFVNFWTTWCHYCVEEMPLIQQSYNLYSYEMVFLAIDEGEYLEDVLAFVEQKGYPFPVLMDPSYDVGDMYYVDGYPMSFFIDEEGIVRYIANGMMEAADMSAGLKSVGVGK